MTEIWKDIQGFEGKYQVSSLGNVMSSPREQSNRYSTYWRKGSLKKPHRNQAKNLVVDLFKDNKYSRYQVKTLVAQHFIDNPNNYRCVQNIDGDKTNCRVENLRWDIMEGTEKELAMRLRSRKSHLKRIYGLTLEDYDTLFEKQKGCCAICDRHQSELRGTFHIDHSHVDGRIRGLLCNNCNKYVVGNHKDGEKLRRAGDYIEKADTGFKVPDEYKKGQRRRRKKKN
jgi:hypothetical protein